MYGRFQRTRLCDCGVVLDIPGTRSYCTFEVWKKSQRPRLSSFDNGDHETAFSCRIWEEKDSFPEIGFLYSFCNQLRSPCVLVR